MRREPIKPEMNVTPLVDVVLVLLIIFMVITPQMEAGAAVDLPGILHPDPRSEGKLEPVTLSLTAAGELYLEKERLDRAAAGAGLKKIHADTPERRVVLKADRAVRYDEVRKLFKQCQEIGFPGVSLQVGDRKKPKESQ
jgi:biopolymer transport protein TolR